MNRNRSNMAAKRSKPVLKHQHHPVAKEKEPEYVVQIQEPRMVRKELLESLRDLIIFMQGYEQFRKLQEEKVTQFSALRNDVKELNHLLDTKLRQHFPRGKVKPAAATATTPAAPKPAPRLAPTLELDEEPEEERPALPVRAPAMRKENPAPAAKKSDLDELEQQLQEIEEQLRDVK